MPKREPTIGLAKRFHSDQPIRSRLEKSSLEIKTSSAPDWRHDICLLNIPDHLRRMWWRNATTELSASSTIHISCLPFKRSLRSFFSFKGVPMPLLNDIEYLIRPPGKTKDQLRYETMPIAMVVNLGSETSSIIINNSVICLFPGDGCHSPVGLPIYLHDTKDKEKMDTLLLTKQHLH